MAFLQSLDVPVFALAIDWETSGYRAPSKQGDTYCELHQGLSFGAKIVDMRSLDVVDETVKVATLEGVAATAENIKAGTYFLSRPFVMATFGEISEQSPAVQDMFAFLSTDEGKELIKSVGLITID